MKKVSPLTPPFNSPFKTINKMKKLIMVLASTVICGAMLLISCSKRTSQTEQQYTGVPLVILDTDIGSSADDLFALEMLYRYDEQDLCRLLGVVVDREGEDCAACADVMGTYFGYGDTPLGLVRDGIKNPKGWIDYKAVPTHADSNGNPMFQRSVSDYSSLPDGWQLYRQLLAAQEYRVQ